MACQSVWKQCMDVLQRELQWKDSRFFGKTSNNLNLLVFITTAIARGSSGLKIMSPKNWWYIFWIDYFRHKLFE